MPKTSDIPRADSVSGDDKILGVSGGKPALIPISQVDFKPASASEEEIKEAVLALHPVGSYYWSSKPDNPETLFGGSWASVNDGRMLRADGKDSTNVGGASSVTLTANNFPAHTHTIPAHTHSAGSHSHTLGSHSHNVQHSHTYGYHAHTNISVPFARTSYAYFANDTSLTQNCPVYDGTSDSQSTNSTYGSDSRGFSLASSSATGSSTGSNAPTVSIIANSSTTGASSPDTSTYGSNSVTLATQPSCQDAYCWVRRA